ncbi:MAG TPA: nodulation protein NfeD [Thermoanaerobaculia bacterium]|nr:nodulation protein NfeD [Thermoanaerobaculia bacterium]
MLPLPSSHRFRLLAAVLTLACGLLLAAAAPTAPPVPTLGHPEVFHIRVSSIVHPVLAEFIADAIQAADQAHAAALVIELDTPGGLMTSMREISTAILSAKTPIVVYVSPQGAQAASAGFFVLMSADVAAMAPGTNAGAAHPVGGQGETIQGTMGEKLEQDAAASIRSLAVRNGRNVALAEAAVLKSRSFSADEALANHLIDLVAPSFPSLLAKLDGRQVKKGEATLTLKTAEAPVHELAMSPLRKLLATIAHPDIAYVLLTLGSLGLFFELMHPGAILPGVVGGICLILGFFAMSVLPVNYAGVALLLLALLFFIAEIKIPSHGMLAVAGIIALVLGSLFLFKTAEPALRVSLNVIVTLATFAALVVGFLSFMVWRAHSIPVRTGREGLLHEHGTAQTALAPAGKVFIHGEIWDAVSENGGPVAAGEPVEVVRIEDFTLTVRPRRPASSASARTASVA